MISTDFRVMGSFFFLSTWPRRVMEECRQSSSSSLYIMLRDSQRLKHMHTHTESQRVVKTHFSNCVPHSLTHSLHNPTHPYPVTLCAVPPTVQIHMFPKSKTKNKKTSESNRPRYMTCLPAYEVGWVGVSLLHLRHPVSSQSKSVSYMYTSMYLTISCTYVGIHYNIHVPMR